LLLDPGLGKTSIILEAFRILKEMGYVKKLFVITPKKPMYSSWGGDEGQIESWANFNHLTWTILHGKDKEENLRLDADIYLINPDGLPWFFGKGAKPDFSRLKMLGDDLMLVVDESTKFKSASSQRFKTLSKVLGKFKRRYILTGTPDPNGLIDLFGQIYILDEGSSLGRYVTHFRTTYFYPSGFGGYTWSPQPLAMERITERISPMVLRMEADDYLQLPERVEVRHVFDLPPDIFKLYKEMEDELVLEIEHDDLIADNEAVASGKCRQITAGGIYRTDALGKREAIPLHTEKLELLESIVEELNGSPILVFYEYEFERDMMLKHFGDKCFAMGRNDKKDQELVVKFNRGAIPVLLLQQQSAMGLNLQKACFHLAFTTQTWKADDHRQCMDRIRRQGNPNSRVFTHYLIARNTIDEVVYKRVVKKDANSKTFAAALKDLRSAR